MYIFRCVLNYEKFRNETFINTEIDIKYYILYLVLSVSVSCYDIRLNYLKPRFSQIKSNNLVVVSKHKLHINGVFRKFYASTSTKNLEYTIEIEAAMI